MPVRRASCVVDAHATRERSTAAVGVVQDEAFRGEGRRVEQQATAVQGDVEGGAVVEAVGDQNRCVPRDVGMQALEQLVGAAVQ